MKNSADQIFNALVESALKEARQGASADEAEGEAPAKERVTRDKKREGLSKDKESQC